MGVVASIFFDVQLPNPTTWFYFSALLAVALYFKFFRVLSIRNVDLLTLYLFMPGFLLLAEGRAHAFVGYLWLLCASLYFLLRCLFDLALERRPALTANLDSGGLAWLAGALFVGLVTVAAKQPDYGKASADSSPASTDPVRIGAEGVIRSAGAGLPPHAGGAEVEQSRLRIWAERGLALLCHLSVVLGLILIGIHHFEDLQAGLSAATFYLLLPYTYMLLPDSPLGVARWDHAWPPALLVWGLYCYRRPMLAGIFPGLAIGSAPFVLSVLPAWMSFYRGRGLGRFFCSFLFWTAFGYGFMGLILWINGELPSSLQSPWINFDWQPWASLSPTSGFWQHMPGVASNPSLALYRVPVFILWLALVLLSGFWPHPKTLAHVVALSAACLIGIQFWYADRGGVYVLWYLPLLLLMVFRPNLSNAVPPTPSEEDLFSRWTKKLRMCLLRTWTRIRWRMRTLLGFRPETQENQR